MFPYIVLFLFVIMIGILQQRVDALNKALLSFFLIIVVALFIGLKYKVGSDSLSYERFFLETKELTEFSFDKVEFMYKYINYLVSRYFDSNQMVYVICGILISICTFKACSVLKINYGYFFSIIMPFHIVMLSISGIRQGVSESIFCYAFSLLLIGRKNKYVILIVSAMTFHTSAIFFLCFYFIKSKLRYILMCVIFLVPMLVILGEDTYGHYVNSSLYNQGVYLRSGMLFILSFFSFFIFKRLNNKNDELRYFYLTALFPFVLLVFAFFSTTIADRISYYFIIADVLIIMNWLNKPSVIHYRKYIIPSLILNSFLFLVVFCYFSNARYSYQYDNVIYHILSYGEY